MKHTTAIAVAVSGGVDSLYALERLREAGHAVQAIHARLLPPDLAPQDYEAMLGRLHETCASLGVPLHVADCVTAFADAVITPFVRVYAAGSTPNPCAHCNAAIKFGLLLDIALSLGCSRLATGHYVRLEPTGTGVALYAGADQSKDQSYFLSLVPVDRLAVALSPLASVAKNEVRAYLAARGIAAPAPRESQEICFVPGDDYRAFLEKRAALLGITLPGKGSVTLPDGTTVGRHNGLWQYTEGQRRGLGIAWKEPLYVLGKELADNTLRVGGATDLGGTTLVVHSPNFLVPFAQWPTSILVRARYRQIARPATVRREGDALIVTEERPNGPYAKGQVAAFYVQELSGLRVLGGGVIG